MQFLISTWGGKAKIKIPSQFNGYASDGDGDGWADVYNPADAILGAAKMLKRNGAPEDVRRSLFIYNRAWWYVDQVMEIAGKYAKDGAVSVPPQAQGVCDETLLEAAPTGTVAGIMEYALAQRGKPYIWGGTGPAGYDCSGIIYMAYRSVGLTIPRTTFGQWPFGVNVPEGEEQAGDLVFFNAGPGTGPSNPGHVGMVVSPGKMVEARCTLCGPIKVTSYKGTDRHRGVHPAAAEPSGPRPAQTEGARLTPSDPKSSWGPRSSTTREDCSPPSVPGRPSWPAGGSSPVERSIREKTITRRWSGSARRSSGSWSRSASGSAATGR